MVKSLNITTVKDGGYPKSIKNFLEHEIFLGRASVVLYKLKIRYIYK
jgi:hypothetical protein